ncbi:MAG: hypothetical protein Q9221_001644 [Calogaya cf. arnoldii]
MPSSSSWPTSLPLHERFPLVHRTAPTSPPTYNARTSSNANLLDFALLDPSLWQAAQSYDPADCLDAEKSMVRDFHGHYFSQDHGFSIIESGSFPSGYHAPGAPLEGILEGDQTAILKVMKKDGRGATYLHALVVFAHGDNAEELIKPVQQAAGKMLRMTYIRTSLISEETAFVVIQIGLSLAFFQWNGERGAQEWWPIIVEQNE